MHRTLTETERKQIGALLPDTGQSHAFTDGYKNGYLACAQQSCPLDQVMLLVEAVGSGSTRTAEQALTNFHNRIKIVE